MSCCPHRAWLYPCLPFPLVSPTAPGMPSEVSPHPGPQHSSQGPQKFPVDPARQGFVTDGCYHTWGTPHAYLGRLTSCPTYTLFSSTSVMVREGAI
jgi:hypothetical protein